MPNQIVFPANFATASAMAFTMPDGSAQLVSSDSGLPVAGPLTDGQLRAAPVAVTISGGGGAGGGGLSDAELRASPVGVAVDEVTDALVTSGTVTAAGVVVAVPTTGFAGGSFHVTSAGTTCTITYEQSNDGVTWVALPVMSLAAATALPVLTSNAAGIYGFVSSAAYVRARVSSYNSGTIAVSLAQKRVAQHVTGTSLAGGAAAIGSVTVSGTINTSIGYTDSTTALAAGATFTGTGRGAAALVQYGVFAASVYADQAGTLYLEHSLDNGANYYPVASKAVTAGTGEQLAIRMTGVFTTATQYRVRYVNDAAAQATFRLSSSFTAA